LARRSHSQHLSERDSRVENISRCSLFLVKLPKNRNIVQNFLKRGFGKKKDAYPLRMEEGELIRFMLSMLQVYGCLGLRKNGYTRSANSMQQDAKRSKEATWQERPASIILIPSWVLVEISNSTKDPRKSLTEDCEEAPLAMAPPTACSSKAKKSAVQNIVV
jgi:hypothetical protein